MPPAASSPLAGTWNQTLGLEVTTVTDEELTLLLPPRPQNMNLRGRLHGGVIATALLEAGRALVARKTDITVHVAPVDFRVFYLNAGSESAHYAVARLLRGGRTYQFIEAGLYDDRHTLVARASYCLRTFSPDQPPAREYLAEPLPPAPPADNAHPVAERLNQRYREQGRGAEVVHLAQGNARVAQQAAPGVLDADGALAPGYLLLLVDSVGSMVSYTGVRQVSLAATVGLDARFHAPIIPGPLTAIGERVSHCGDLYHNRVAIFADDTGDRVASASVTYLLRQQAAEATPA